MTAQPVTPRSAARNRFIPALLFAAVTTTAALANPAGVEVVAVTGTPTANGVMASFNLQPSIGNGGHVSYHAYLTGTALGVRDAYAHFRSDATNPAAFTELGRMSDPLPDGNGLMEHAYYPSMTASGVGCGASFFMGTNAGEDDDYAIMTNLGGTPTIVARQGSPMPGNLGTYDGLESPVIDSQSRITFWADTEFNQPGYFNAIFRWQAGVTSVLFGKGQPAPGGVGVFQSVYTDPDIKATGAFAFRARLDGVGDNLHDDRVFRHDGPNPVTIAREGDLSPDANGQLWESFSFYPIARMSENGHVAFRSDLLGTSGGTADNAAIFRGTGGPLTKIARKGQPSPDGNGYISDVYIPDVANSGTVMFSVEFSGTSGGTNDDYALVTGSGGPLTIIMREGYPTPGGDGQFAPSFYNWNCNAAGEMAIRVELQNTEAGGVYQNAIYFHRPGQPLFEVARNGTPMLGSTITLLNSTDQSFAPTRSPINDSGQIAFYFQLADGREGIARFTPPPFCRGDFNNDGQRNTLDLTIFLGKFGQVVAPYSAGDMNGDGAVNTLDLTAFLGVFGIPCNPQ